jgi:hypothetical protein
VNLRHWISPVQGNYHSTTTFLPEKSRARIFQGSEGCEVKRNALWVRSSSNPSTLAVGTKSCDKVPSDGADAITESFGLLLEYSLSRRMRD